MNCSHIIAVLGFMLTQSAWAQESGGETLSLDDLEMPTFELEVLNPKVSYEFGVHMSFGTVSYWREYFPAYVGMGIRFSAGRNFGNHRFGGVLTGNVEGPFGVFSSTSIEPAVAWDYITPFNMQLGAHVVPSVMLHTDNTNIVRESEVTLNPVVAVRAGYSQKWTRLQRRLYVLAEPKARIINGIPDYGVALVVGSGSGI